jgi:cyclase
MPRFLVTLALFLVFTLLAPAQAREPAPPNGTLHLIIPGHYAYYSNGFVSGVIVTPDGVVVVDALGDEATAKDERQLIASTIKQPVRYLISSSFHDNYSRGNVVYQAAVRIGHENYRTDLLNLMKSVPVTEQQARVPHLTYRDHLTIYLGGKEIRILHVGRAHTSGDSIVFVPADRIVYMSELFFYDRFPWMADGYVNWINAIDVALNLDADIFVPAHGTMAADPRESRQALIRFRQILIDARDAVEKAIAHGATEDKTAATVLLPQYRNLNGYQQQREVVVRRIYRDLKSLL